MELQYKTIKMSDPRGKPRVFFSCHPDDFNMAFPLVSEDILQHANCVIWYDARMTSREAEKTPEADMQPPGKTEEVALEEVLDRMQLVVFAVTSRFLNEPNRARETELPLALQMHIPVLPIMLENGLGYAFSNTCAKIQVVPKYGKDSTAIPYDEVLQTFLDATLVGDELAQKVRDAFDAYVFMSYRKKDRRYAQRLMRRVHANPMFRDIAIWYDEYLVPGEGFNEAIKAAFAKSGLFTMTVTSHLEEEGNYVMRVEYPMARERKEQEDSFQIVSVEMYDKEDPRINQESLKGHKDFKYPYIEDLHDEYDVPGTDQAFADALERIARKEHDATPEHLFYIGLAYLGGIDVEIDSQRALKLLKEAATDKEDPCMAATAKLADMYRYGEGVQRDSDEAIRWQRLLAGQYRDAYDKNHDPDEHRGYGTSCFKALRKLSDMLLDTGDLKGATQSALQALAFCGKLEEEVGVREQERDKALILNRLGSLYKENWDYDKAQDCYVQANRIYERQAREIGTRRVRRDLSISYERLGDLSRKTGDLRSAKEFYAKACRIRRELLDTAPSAGRRRDLSYVLTKLGNICKSEKEMDEAEDYYAQALGIDEILAEEIKTPQAKDDYGVSLVKIGDIDKYRGQLSRAGLEYEKARGIFRNCLEKSGSRIFQDHYAGASEKLASVKKKTGDVKRAGTLYTEAVKVRREQYGRQQTPETAHALATACYNAAVFLDDEGLMREAFQIWDRLSSLRRDYRKYRDMAAKALGEEQA